SGADRLVVRERGAEPREVELPRLELIDRAGCLAEFAAAVSTGRTPETSGRDNLATLSLCEALVKSARRRIPVTPAEVPTKTKRPAASSRAHASSSDHQEPPRRSEDSRDQPRGAGDILPIFITEVLGEHPLFGADAPAVSEDHQHCDDDRR